MSRWSSAATLPDTDQGTRLPPKGSKEAQSTDTHFAQEGRDRWEEPKQIPPDDDDLFDCGGGDYTLASAATD